MWKLLFSVFSALDDIMAYPKSFGKTRTAGRVGKMVENVSAKLRKTQQDLAKLSIA